LSNMTPLPAGTTAARDVTSRAQPMCSTGPPGNILRGLLLRRQDKGGRRPSPKGRPRHAPAAGQQPHRCRAWSRVRRSARYDAKSARYICARQPEPSAEAPVAEREDQSRTGLRVLTGNVGRLVRHEGRRPIKNMPEMFHASKKPGSRVKLDRRAIGPAF